MAGKFRLDDLDIKRRKYTFVLAYGQSKAMNVLFAYKLDRLLKEAGTISFKNEGHTLRTLEMLPTSENFDGIIPRIGKNFKVILTHPGLVCTNINNDYAFVRVLGMRAEKGAQVNVVAAASEDIESRTYLGVGGCAATYGNPAPIKSARYTHDTDLQDKLWEVSENRTDVKLAL